MAELRRDLDLRRDPDDLGAEVSQLHGIKAQHARRVAATFQAVMFILVNSDGELREDLLELYFVATLLAAETPLFPAVQTNPADSALGLVGLAVARPLTANTAPLSRESWCRHSTSSVRPGKVPGPPGEHTVSLVFVNRGHTLPLLGQTLATLS